MDVSRFDYEYSDRKDFHFALMSDIHMDSPGFDKARFTADMDNTANKGGKAFFNGDLVDAIFPTDRKRYARSANANAEDAQINGLAQSIAEQLAPYADIIDYIGIGNHEVSIVKFNNLDIIALIVMLLNQKRSKKIPPIKRGGYVGFINLVFSRKGDAVRRYVIYRDHGKGGNSPVTKGTIGLNRLYGTYDADVYWLGHSHQSILDSTSQWSIGVTPQGKLYQKNKVGIITPGYSVNFGEREYNNDSDYYRLNFPEERFYAPTGIGYGQLDINLTGDNLKARIAIV